jgi:hypothetical protein
MNASLFERIPGPSPWFLRDGDTPMPGFHWQAAENGPLSSGKRLLIGSSGPVAVLDFYNYVLPLDQSTLLIWHQKRVERGPTAPVVLTVIRPKSLQPLRGDRNSLFARLKESGEPLLVSTRGPFFFSKLPTNRTTLKTAIASEQVNTKFSPEIAHLEELLILCSSSATNPSSTCQEGNLALLVASPAKSSFRLYPQDWFNNGKIDYDYQWVTRVARNPSTGRIHGEGIRIPPFVLDESLRMQALDP